MTLGRRIDRVPGPVAAAVGIAAGLGVGLVVAGLAPLSGGIVFAVAAGGGLWVAYRGESVTVLEEPRRPESTDGVEGEGPGAMQREEGSAEFDALAMVEIPAGRFVMGSGEDDESAHENERPAHEVELSGFEYMVYPVTRGLYAEVMGEDPGWPDGEAHGRLPVNLVSWYDAVRFCNRLSQRHGLEACYEVEDEGDEVDVVWKRESDGYRLPTEAEWEYACRAGRTTRWWFGDDEARVVEYAWIDQNSSVEDTETGESERRPHAVGEKPENPWGLHDMHGNVFEWCWDWYGRYSGSADPVLNPSGPTAAHDGTKVLRGGAFDFWAWDARCAVRIRFGPEDRFRSTGFRCVRGSGRQA